MKPWNRRPFEVRNLFNPAFCGLILFRSLEGYDKVDDRGMPFSLSFLILPLSLHKDSRAAITENPRRYLLKTAEKKQGVLVGFPDRVTEMIPFTLEGFGILSNNGCISVTKEGRIKSLKSKIRSSLKGTAETISCQKAAKIIGKEFAQIGDRATIYTTFGIRP